MRRAGAWVLACVLAACAGPGLFTDGTSVSRGRTNDGRVRQPARLPLHGPGFVVPPRWRSRGFQWGTDELVAALQRATKLVRQKDHRAVTGLADLSRRRGGPSAWHNSHHAGRDVDVLFYTADDKGVPLAPAAHDMIAFGGDGLPYVPESKPGYREPDWARRRFDDRRNWAFLQALLGDPTVRVQWVFVSDALEARLLRYARRTKKPAWAIEYARVVMQQPADAPPHDDHFHIRVYCSRQDRFHGCQDRGVIWQHEKRTFKHYGPERYDPVTWRHTGLRADPLQLDGG